MFFPDLVTDTESLDRCITLTLSAHTGEFLSLLAPLERSILIQLFWFVGESVR
jgi:hypothetical protein